MNMTVPKSYQLFGAKIPVKVVNEVVEQGGTVIGLYDPALTMVKIQKPGKRPQMTRARFEETFCHELVHSILHAMRSPNWDNEDFVEDFAQLLHQALTSGEGDITRGLHFDKPTS